MRSTLRSFLSLLLCIAMCLSVLPVTALASEVPAEEPESIDTSSVNTDETGEEPAPVQEDAADPDDDAQTAAEASGDVHSGVGGGESVEEDEAGAAQDADAPVYDEAQTQPSDSGPDADLPEDGENGPTGEDGASPVPEEADAQEPAAENGSETPADADASEEAVGLVTAEDESSEGEGSDPSEAEDDELLTRDPPSTDPDAVSGTTENGLIWELNDAGDAVITGCDASLLPQNLVIPAEIEGHPVKTIGEFAFEDCYVFSNVTLSEGIEVIEDYAFQGCYNWSGSLRQVTLPESLTTIGSRAFDGCCDLSGDIYISANVTSIGLYAFAFTNISGFTVSPDNAYFSSDSAGFLFNKDRTVLLQVSSGISGSCRIPDGVNELESNSFRRCESLTEVIIPADVSVISYDAFTGCDHLKTIRFEHTDSDPLTIGDNAFACWNESNVTTLVCVPDPEHVHPAISGYDWEESCRTPIYISPEAAPPSGEYEGLLYGPNEDCTGLTITGYTARLPKNLVIPAEIEGFPVKSIEEDVFSDCDKLVSVVLSEGIEVIGDFAFRECRNLSSVTLPESLISVGQMAFSYCWGFTGEIYISENLLYIGEGAFSNTDISRFTVSESNPNYCSDSYGVLFSKDLTVLKTAPSGLSGRYIVPDGVLILEDGAFGACSSSLTGITLPDSLTTIGSCVFYDCYQLTELHIPAGVTQIGDQPFPHCSSMTRLSVDSANPNYRCDDGKVLLSKDGTVLYQAVGSLSGCYRIPESVTTLYNCCFQGCRYLAEVIIPARVTYISTAFFDGIEKLKTIRFEHEYGDPLTISENAFDAWSYNDKPVSTLVCVPDPEHVNPAIEEYDWENSHRSVTFVPLDSIPQSGEYEGLTYTANADGTSLCITGYADECPSALVIPAEIDGLPVTAIGENAFENCYEVESVVLPDTITLIDAEAFFECQRITSLEIPDSVTTIGYRAFESLMSLTSLTIPAGVSSIGARAFCGLDCPITVNPDNPYFCALDGVLYSKDMTTLKQATCAGSGSFTVPAGVTVIDEGAFTFTYYEEVLLPETLTTIGEWAFGGVHKLNSLSVPSSVTSIGSGAFHTYSETVFHLRFEHDAEASLTVDEWQNTPVVIQVPDVDHIHPALTAAWPEDDPDVTYLPLSVEAFGVYNGLKYSRRSENSITIIGYTNALPAKVVIPAQINGVPVTRIDDNAFRDCYAMTSVTIPESVTSIGDMAFSWCDGLTEVSIPASVVSMEFDDECPVFYHCDGLQRITVDPDNPCYTSDSQGILYDKAMTTLLQYPLGRAEACVIPACVRRIEDYSFNFADVTAVTIPEGVEYIGEVAFSYCMNLTEITIPASVTYIGTYGFNMCTEMRVIAFSHTAGDRISFGEGVFNLWYEPMTTILYLSDDAPSSITGYDWEADQRSVVINPSAPVIVTQPRTGAALSGKKATFQVTAVGMGLSYQWQTKKPAAGEWKNVSGGTGSTLSVTVTSKNAGDLYRCIVSNEIGEVVSDEATLVMFIKPKVNTKAVTMYSEPGDTVTIVLRDLAGYGLQFEWYTRAGKKDSWQSLGYGSSYLRVTAGDAGTSRQYRCLVSNPAGKLYSGVITVKAQAPVSITGQSSSVKVASGKKTTLSVTAAGTSLRYQWFYRAGPEDAWHKYTGKGAASRSITFAVKKNGYEYCCRVYNDLSSAYCQSVTVTQVKKAKITLQPVSAKLTPGTVHAFTAEAAGMDLSYQWYFRPSSKKAWIPIEGDTSETLTVTAAAAGTAYQYRCCVSNIAGSVYTKTVTLGSYDPVTIIADPVSVSVAYGKKTRLSVAAEGTALKYQWYYRTNEAGAWKKYTGSGYKTSAITITVKKNGYEYFCRVTNPLGAADTAAAAVTCVSKPKITSQPVSAAVSSGCVDFSVAASGMELTYQWYCRSGTAGSWTAIEGACGEIVSVSSLVYADGTQFRCTVSNIAGTVNSSAVTFYVIGN